MERVLGLQALSESTEFDALQFDSTQSNGCSSQSSGTGDSTCSNNCGSGTDDLDW
jgi:hypothetical protein